MTELRPRWLPVDPVSDETEAGSPDLEADLAEAESLLALTEYPQWETLANKLKQAKQEAIDRMLDPNVQQMTVLAAYRARARVLQWILDIPNDVLVTRDTLLEQEAALREEEHAEQ